MVDKSSEKIKKMFNKAALNYDVLNNLISLFSHYFVKTTAIKTLKIKPKAKVLDLCCGSGDLGRIIKKIHPDSVVVGADFSSEMLKIAQRKNPEIDYVEQDAVNLLFQDNSFDYVVMGFGLRNIENIEGALNQIQRVLKQDGQFLHLDFGCKNFVSKVYDKLLSVFIKLFIKDKESYLYLLNSKKEFFEPQELVKIFENTGFNCICLKNPLFGIISFQIMKK